MDFERNRYGLLIPPQTTSTAIGFLLSIIGLLIPVIVLARSGGSEFRSYVLQDAPTFKILSNAGLISDGKIGEFEFLFVFQILAQMIFAVFFFGKTAREFSKESPPPFELRASWPRFIFGLLAAGVIATGLPLVWGFAAESAGYLSSKFLFLTLAILALGPSFLIEGLLACSLLVFSHYAYRRSVT